MVRAWNRFWGGLGPTQIDYKPPDLVLYLFRGEKIKLLLHTLHYKVKLERKVRVIYSTNYNSPKGVVRN